MKKSYIQGGRTKQKLETRTKILETAQHFLNKGQEFNLETIAKKSGISRATIYRYFSNVDVLAAEAGLQVSTKSPEHIVDNLKGLKLEEQVQGIQSYYNKLAIDHDKLFRKYISTILDSSTPTPKRGARRKRTLELVLNDTQLSDKEKEDLSNLMTVFMGIEPLIVTKDVCGLSNEQSLELLDWGMQLMLKGFMTTQQKN